MSRGNLLFIIVVGMAKPLVLIIDASGGTNGVLPGMLFLDVLSKSFSVGASLGLLNSALSDVINNE